MAKPRARAPCRRSRRYDALRRQGDLGSRRCRLVHHPLSPRSPRAPHAEAAAQRSRPRDRADGDLGHGTGGPSLYLRGQQRPALCQLSVSSLASVARRRAIRRLALAVLQNAQGPWAQLVGDAGSARPAHPGDERHLQPRAASDVFGVLAVGAGAGAPVAELDRGACGPDRLRDVVLSACRTRGGADDRDLRRRLPPLHGADLAHLARDLLASSPRRHAWASALAALGAWVSWSILCACATAWRAASLWVKSSSFSVSSSVTGVIAKSVYL